MTVRRNHPPGGLAAIHEREGSKQMSGNLTRRTVVASAIFTAVAGTLPTAHAAPPRPGRFPRGFRWGVATAAHQVEGNNLNSDCWFLEGMPNSPFIERSGDACDHYHRYEEDIARIAALGLNTYRFSIEWARVEPVEGLFSDAILLHYGRMLAACRRHQLTTVVTLQHFTLPLWFAAKGGFEHPDAPALFARYARRVAEVVGGDIDWLCTINEANLSFAPSPRLRAAAAKQLDVPQFSTFLFSDTTVSKPIVRQAHAAARAAIKAVRPRLPVGYTLAMDDVQDAPDAPGRGTALRSAVYDVWLDAARGDDFIGVQNYTRVVVGPKGPMPPARDAPRTQIGQEIWPASLGGAVRYAAQRARVPILVTENGIGVADDAQRIRYIDAALEGLATAIADGVDVRGYVHWSLLDNFEWLMGYRPKFGLIAVDRATQRRSPKPSARHLGQIARRNGAPLPSRSD
jgi:beta-glucosidase